MRTLEPLALEERDEYLDRTEEAHVTAFLALHTHDDYEREALAIAGCASLHEPC